MDYSAISLGEAPDDDKWQAFYRLYYRCVRPVPVFRALVRWYFLPRGLEAWNKGAIYRFLGVAAFGRIIPTGGVRIRRITGAGMVDYTLQCTTLASARKFFFRACAFEAAHSLVFISVSVVVVICCVLGRTHLAVGGTVANLVVNAYPMLLQRYTRVRILRLLARRPRTCPAVRTL
ncbi:MAG: glycosyl-4,4'-diaponeurosporenoate acyltransferase CrtO family protein [Planctomycetota bacterium]